jgi:hypothetical protein
MKLLLEGDASTGKTSALISLIAAGYKLRILDYDNKLDSLRAFVEHYCPDRTFESVSLRDRVKASPNGTVLDGPPKAFSAGLDLLDKWSDGTKPAEWGQDYILVIDTLTTMTAAAFNWAKLMAGHLSYVEGVNVKGGPDPRNLIYTAQRAVMNMLMLLTGEWFDTNVIVLSHIKYFEREDGKTKSYPVTIGSAIAPEVPTSFSCVAQLETTTVGGIPTRIIQTVSTPMIDLQNPKPFQMPKIIPIPDLTVNAKGLENSGLAHFFSIIRG